MLFNVERSSSETLLPATMQEDAPAVASWRSADASRYQRRPSGRVRTLVAAIVITCALTGLLTWATTSIGPAPHVSLALASTDYRNQLNLPINGFGDHAIGRLAALATAGGDHWRRHIELFGTPIELATAADFSRIQVDPAATVAIVYLSAHGVSSPRGPLLIPADAQNLADAVELTSIIHQLATLPAAQHKVLLIDGPHFKSLPSFGIIHNHFSRQVRELNDLIESIANLVVLISADTDQQSWVDPDQGTTVWSAAMIDALRGNARDLQNDGWIDLYDIHESASQATQTWTERICGESQRPLLLPLDAIGQARLRRTALYPANQPIVDVPVLPLNTRNDLLADWWMRHQKYANRAIHPSIVNPVLWQRFEASILRLEQFELAGCRDAANRCVDQLNDLDGMLSRPTLIDSIACRTGVLNPELVGFNPGDDLIALADHLGNHLPGLSVDAVKREWLATVASQRHSENVAFLRRSLMLSQTLKLCETMLRGGRLDRKRLTDAAALFDCIGDPIQPPPQIGLITQLLARDLPKDELDSQDATRIARWLQLCLRMETISDNHDWWTPVVFDWTTDAIADGDRQRRIAGDLLLGDSVARARAETHLVAAEQAYASVDRIAVAVCKAEHCLAQGRHQLRRIHELCATFLQTQSTDAFQEHANRVISLYSLSDEIDSLVKHPDQRSQAQDDALLIRLASLSSRFEHQLDELSSQIDHWQMTVFNGDATHFPRLMAALSVTGGKPQERIAAWQRFTRFAASGSARDAKVGSAGDLRISQESLAASRGRLAIAAWPAQLFDSMVSAPYETKQQVLHRLETFAAESQWWESLSKACHELGRRECGDRPTWNLSGSSVAAIEFARVRLHEQQQTLGRFLSAQADRVYYDGYWSLEHSEPAYYERASELLRSDSIALLKSDSDPRDGHQPPETRFDHGKDSMGIDLICPNTLVWTTQQSDTVPIRIDRRHDRQDGFATLWVHSHGSIKLLQPEAGERACKSLNDDNPTLVTLQRADETPSLPSQLDVLAYFRGRQLRSTIAMQVADHPDVQIVSPPKPTGGRIAVRSIDAPQSGKGSAVTLVLDCSGSMGAKPGEPFSSETKYAHAVDAVAKLLNALPTGTELSIWAFGQATGPGKTLLQAEQSIRQVQAGFAWDAQDQKLRSRIIDSISYPRLEPWNESPLFAAMLAAANDLKAHDGPRCLIVITDGHDNRIANDPVANPLRLPADQWLKKYFNGTGITVNVIAFQVESHEKQETRRQLTSVESLLPPGRFVQVEQASELAETLRKLLTVSPMVEIRRNVSDQTEKIKLTVSNASETAATWTNRLEAGLYQVSTGSAEKPTLIEVRDGDQIVLGASNREMGRLELWPIMRHEYQWCRQKQASRWQVAMEPLATSDANSIRRRLVLWSQSLSDTVCVQSPRGLWIEASRDNQPLRVRWQASSQQPGASFEITADSADWSEPEFKIWISDQPALPVATLRKGDDFAQLSDFASMRWQVSEGTVTLLSATIESHRVIDEEGTKRSLPCLVLRASVPPESKYHLRTEGLIFDGFDEQYFHDLGQYTLRQWPVTAPDVEQSLKAIHLISIDQFKKEAERRGSVVTFAAETGSKLGMEPRLTAKPASRSQP